MEKKGQMWESLIPWIIAIAVLALVIVMFFVLKGRGGGALEFLKNLVKFGR